MRRPKGQLLFYACPPLPLAEKCISSIVIAAVAGTIFSYHKNPASLAFQHGLETSELPEIFQTFSAIVDY